jgi:hypothetical protein
MDHEHKEEAKKILGFKQVPFYVVLDQEGEIVQMGSKKFIDFEHLPGMIEPQQEKGDRFSTEDNVNVFQILDLDVDF